MGDVKVEELSLGNGSNILKGESSTSMSFGNRGFHKDKESDDPTSKPLREKDIGDAVKYELYSADTKLLKLSDSCVRFDTSISGL